jgi:hypothetical protein
VAKVREYEKTAADKEAAMKQAIMYCIDHDILKEFLQTNSSEVINMLLTDRDISNTTASIGQINTVFSTRTRR